MRSSKKSTTSYIMFVVIAILIGIATFQSEHYTIGADSSDAVWVKTTWWGFHNEYRPVRWFNGSWNTKGKDGGWYAIVENDSDVPEQVPVR